jgi:DHA1 family multidrug resistance protein-like MFS transporter
MMETIRDSAFGKLFRFLSGYRLLLYPEEMDDFTWRRYLQTPEAYAEEGSTPPRGEGFYEMQTLHTVMSQASRRRRQRPPLKSVLAGPWHGVKEGRPEVIGWRGPDDSEVCSRSRMPQRCIPADRGEISG